MVEPQNGEQSREAFERALVEQALASDIMQESIHMQDQVLRDIGLNHPSVMTTIAAVRLGARQVLALHDASPEELKTVFKAADGATPRTEADLRSGIVGKGVIAHYHPDDGMNEEESEATAGTTGVKREYDPMDGTSSFAEGQRYSTVGMEVNEGGVPVVAAICHPFERELLVAQEGGGSWLFPLEENMLIKGAPRKLAVSPRKDLKGGVVYMDALFNTKTTPHKLAFMNGLSTMTGNIGFRMTGSNIDQQRHVAKGSAVASVTDAVGGFYDFSGRLIIEQAGGMFTDMYGNPVTRQTQLAIGSNSYTHQQLLDVAQQTYVLPDGRPYGGFR